MSEVSTDSDMKWVLLEWVTLRFDTMILTNSEVHFAKESFNARLKAEGDDNSTNLYLSNLPKRLTEAVSPFRLLRIPPDSDFSVAPPNLDRTLTRTKELNAIFSGYNVVSSKILRDSMGNSRGVGFARSVFVPTLST